MRSTVRAKITDREIMQQALEALETANESDFWIKQESIVKALRERLAHCDRCGKKLGGTDDIHTCSPQRKPQPEQEPVELCERICAAIKSADDKSVSEADYMLDSDDCIEIVRAHFVVGEPTQPQRKPDHIVDANKMVPFQDLAAELFVVAQISPADDGFSDTITRIESWLRNHFSTPPQRKPLTDEDTVALIKQCRDAFAEELGAWDIDPPIHHVQQGYDNCVNWLAAHGITGEQHG